MNLARKKINPNTKRVNPTLKGIYEKARKPFIKKKLTLKSIRKFSILILGQIWVKGEALTPKSSKKVMQYCTIWTSINRSLSAFLFEKKIKINKFLVKIRFYVRKA